MKLRKVRASALFNVLVVLSLVFVVAFFLMAALSSHLQLNSRYHRRTQLDFVARAATNEVLLRFQTQPNPDPSKPPPPHLKSLGPGPEVPLFSATSNLPYSAWLLLERSVDNGQNPDPAQSCFDSNGHKSVPPFSLSLAIKILGSDGYHVYESLVQQRWPYALVAPGPIFLCGGIDPEHNPGLPGPIYCTPSLVEGRVLALSGNATAVNPLLGLTLSNSLLTQLLPFASPDRRKKAQNQMDVYGGGGVVAWGVEDGLPKRLKVGGDLASYGESPDSFSDMVNILFSSENQPDPPIPSRGALVDGGVDLMENASLAVSKAEVSVDKDSKMTGSVRKDYHLGAEDPKSQEARERLAQIFSKPDTSDWPEYEYNGQAAGLQLNGQNVPTGRCRLVLPSQGKNRRKAVQLEDTSVSLNNVELAVPGNFVLTGCNLSGSGASLVVDGTLVLDGGQLEAGDNGLVIFCRQLISRASGHFKGLIIAQQGANFHGGGKGEKLVIEGGLMLGANAMAFSNDDTGFSIPGLALCSTELHYSPQYLRGLNRYADFTTIGMVLRD